MQNIKNGSKNLFVEVVINLLQKIPINVPKFKEECFINVKTFVFLFPKQMMKHMNQLA